MNKIVSICIACLIASNAIADSFEGHSISYTTNGPRISGIGDLTWKGWQEVWEIYKLASHVDSVTNMSMSWTNDVISGKKFIGLDNNGNMYITDIKSFTWQEWKCIIDEFEECKKTALKQRSDLYRCAENDFVWPADRIYDYDSRLNMARDLVNARASDIRQVSKKLEGEMKVYFEICGSGYSMAERHAIEKEIQEAIKKILDKHFGDNK